MVIDVDCMILCSLKGFATFGAYRFVDFHTNYLRKNYEQNIDNNVVLHMGAATPPPTVGSKDLTRLLETRVLCWEAVLNTHPLLGGCFKYASSAGRLFKYASSAGRLF
jgi:hypothetical protein